MSLLSIQPTNIKTTIFRNNVDITFTRGENAVKTELIKLWDNATIVTAYQKFPLTDLEWGKTYSFKMIGYSAKGQIEETEIMTFEIPALIVPVLPTNVKISTFRNNVDINFTRNGGVKTQIDAYWISGEGTFDQETVSGTKFNFTELPWGATYKFKLRSVGNDGSTLDTVEYSFAIPDLIPPVLPTGINTTIYKNNVDINFVRNGGVKTQLDCKWIGGIDSFEQETVSGSRFSLTDLPWGNKYQYSLRSVGNDGSTLDTQVLEFEIPKEIIPVAPSDVKVTVYKNNVDINFTAGVGIKTEIDCYWVDGQGTWDSQTVTGTRFSYTGLPWGTTYKFKLRCVGNSGLVAETQEYSFTIVPNFPVVIPKITDWYINNNQLVINFVQGKNNRTRLKIWADDVNTPKVEALLLKPEDNKIVVSNLYWKQHYYFTLQEENPAGDVAITPVEDFYTSSQH